MGDIRTFVFAIEDTETTQGLCKIIGRSSLYNLESLSRPYNLYFDDPGLSRKHAVLCIKTPIPKIESVPSIEQLRICIRDLSSKSGTVNLVSDGPNDEIDLRSGDTFGLIAIANHSLRDNHYLAAKLIFRIELEYFDKERELIKCIITNVTFGNNNAMLHSPVYPIKFADDSDSSWYGLSEASTQTEAADECHETKTMITRGGRFSILSLRKSDRKQPQKAGGSFDGKINQANSFEEEIETCTDTESTEEEEEEVEEEEEEEDQGGEIELEIIRVKRIKGRIKTEKTATRFSKTKRIMTPQQSNSMWILLIVILIFDRLLSN
ncbi:uncharacterized protein SPAR_G01630 [Saccharomyces paradoxus]|uniref:FHA domain-containing protein n=1 Tax=Saccharomyces paradoxus TaxID=27291 RepID=A0A8B8UR71_SACPA|nr:uncharacterized protein SPAR_G01630 [Saccharomyces paradoxus]QHS73253.1 hypothetical protein SPAR_G01630 [Saccharomyces paradoxus]